MKVELTEKFDGAIYGKRVVVITELTKEQTDELRKALAIVDKYKLLAHKTAKHKEQNCDWSMTTYAVKTDKIIITIEDGACG